MFCPYDGYKLRKVRWGGYFGIAGETFYAYCHKRHRFRVRITTGYSDPVGVVFEPLDAEEWVEAKYGYDAVEPRGG